MKRIIANITNAGITSRVDVVEFVGTQGGDWHDAFGFLAQCGYDEIDFESQVDLDDDNELEMVSAAQLSLPTVKQNGVVMPIVFDPDFYLEESHVA